MTRKISSSQPCWKKQYIYNGAFLKCFSILCIFVFLFINHFGFEARLGPDSGHCLPLQAWEVGKHICFVLSVRPSERKNEMG